MLCIKKCPDKVPELVNIPNTLFSLQCAVGGYIEVVQITTDAAIICNEEGRLLGLSHNCSLLGTEFVGTILVVGTHGEDFCSLRGETARKLIHHLFPIGGVANE